MKRRISFIVSLSALAALYNSGFEPINVVLAMILVPALTWLIYQGWKQRDRQARAPVTVTLDDYANRIKENLVKKCLNDYETMRLVFEWGFNRNDFEELAGIIAVVATGIVEEAGRDISEDPKFIDLLLEVVLDGNVVSKYHEYKESGKNNKEKQVEMFRAINDAFIDVMSSTKGLAYVVQEMRRDR